MQFKLGIRVMLAGVPQTLIKNAYEQYEKVSNTFVEVLHGYRTRESLILLSPLY